jgi:Zn-dependent protease with chaperone function
VDREYVLTALSFAVCGSAMFVVGGLLKAAPLREWHLIDLERVSWIRVVLPFLAGLCAFAALMGWWALEPDDSESVPLPVFLAAGAVGVVWLRALARAAWALRTAEPVAATVGLLRPRVILSEAFQAAVDGNALRAAGAHEEAHARHRDPLRVWFAQFVTDLQWPLPAALLRLDAWREALEMVRDDEARQYGVDGVDLAAAVLEAARLQRRCTIPLAALGEEGRALERRIARLLAPVEQGIDRRPRSHPLILFLLGITAAACAGAIQGESVVGTLFGPR